MLQGIAATARGPSGGLLGALFESLVTQSIRVYAQHAESSVHHLRTARGRQEVDLIVRAPDQCAPDQRAPTPSLSWRAYSASS